MERVPQKVFKATVFATEMVAEGVKKITFKISEPFSFLTGQYVWAEIPELKTKDSRGNRRAFSICNVPNKENTISIVTRISESGYKQTLFALSVGHEMKIHGPFGSSFVLHNHKSTGGNIIMIAGGVGIAAFLAIIEAIKNQTLSAKIFLVYLNTNKEMTPFLKELDALKRNNNFFDYTVKYNFFSWKYVKDAYKSLDCNTEWWVSGPQAMIDYTYGILEKNGVSMLDMVFENNYPAHKNSLTFGIREQLEKNGLFSQIIQNSNNHTIITDINGIVLFANKAVELATGYSQEEILGNTPRLWGGMMSAEFYKNFWSRKRSEWFFESDIINRHKSGKIYYATAQITQIFNDSKELIGYIGVEKDISKEKEADRIKSEFISLASHQLRTPLTGIEWTAELFAKKEKLTTTGKKYLHDIYFSAKRLSTLVKLLLDVSRIEGGTISVSPEPLDLVLFVEEHLQNMHVLCEKKRLTCFLAKKNPKKCVITTDKNLLGYIVQNIISNAVEYTNVGGKVSVALEEQKDAVLIKIQDTGIGIPKKEQGRIFEKFFRASNALTVKPDGTGLGLYIVSEAVKLLGGEISFKSDEGRGSTFSIKLPLVAQAHAGEKGLNQALSA